LLTTSPPRRYEFWKKVAIDQLGMDSARENRAAIYLGASAIAEFFADIALCPLEATRIRLVSQPTFASGLLPGFARIAREEGVAGFYAGFGPILFKQVPYTMAKFAVFEVAQEKIIATTGKTKEQLVGSQLTMVNLAGGLIAGMAAAVISQPADTLLSKINKQKGEPGQGTMSRIITMSKQLGPAGLFTVSRVAFSVPPAATMLSQPSIPFMFTGYRCQVVHDRYLDRRSVHDLRRHQASFGSQRRCRDPKDRQVDDIFTILPACDTIDARSVVEDDDIYTFRVWVDQT
jgi:hypothetical protein